MIERIKNKLSEHVEELLQKDSITNEEFWLLDKYAEKLEFLSGKEEREKESAENRERMKAMLNTVLGGDLIGM